MHYLIGGFNIDTSTAIVGTIEELLEHGAHKAGEISLHSFEAIFIADAHSGFTFIPEFVGNNVWPRYVDIGAVRCRQQLYSELLGCQFCRPVQERLLIVTQRLAFTTEPTDYDYTELEAAEVVAIFAPVRSLPDFLVQFVLDGPGKRRRCRL